MLTLTKQKNPFVYLETFIFKNCDSMVSHPYLYISAVFIGHANAPIFWGFFTMILKYTYISNHCEVLFSSIVLAS